jgi:3-hydroxybutyrate dehydrogenase
MERFLEGRTALVTGSIQGIGMAIARALASAGARIGVHGLATQQAQQLPSKQCARVVAQTRVSSMPICAIRPRSMR